MAIAISSSQRFRTKGLKSLNDVSVFAPGKLFLAGEYAVLKRKQPALIIPLKIGITVTIKKSHHTHITSDVLAYKALDLNQLPRDGYIKKSLDTAMHYLADWDIPFSPMAIEITSDLHDEKRQSLGLGSSGALTIAIIAAVLRFHQKKICALKLYKLAVIAQIQHQAYASFGDLACIAFNRPVHYEKFYHPRSLENETIRALVAKSWDGLIIHPIGFKRLPGLIIHTNQKADSHAMVQQMQQIEHNPRYEMFLLDSKVKTLNFIYHLKKGTLDKAKIAVDKLNRWFETFDAHENITLYTKKMRDIHKVVQSVGGAFKFCGAGGGDNVLALFDGEDQKERAAQILKARGFNIIACLKGWEDV